MKPTGFRTRHRLPVAAAAGLGLLLAAAGCDGHQPQPPPQPPPTAEVVPSLPAPSGSPAAPTGVPADPIGHSPDTPRQRPTPAGGPVPAGFVAWSVTFVSDREAYVLGDAPCRVAPCTSVVRTLDGGRSWRGVPAPRASLPARTPAAPSRDTVREIRFATGQDGYAFGGGLWATHDGARTWRRVSGLDTVLDLEIDGGTAYAAVGHCASPDRCRSGLLASPVSADRFRPVAGFEPRPTSGPDAAVSTGAGLTVVSFDGARYVHRRTAGWSRMTEPCRPLGGPVVTPASGATLTAYCAEGAAGSVFLTVRQSSDLGRHWTTTPGRALGLPDGLTGLTAGSATTLAAAAAVPDLGGALAVSRNGGRTWSTVPTPAHSIGWRFVGARSATALVALLDPPSPTLWTSDTAGRTWTVHPIR